MHIDTLKKLSHTGMFTVSEADRREWETPCACPSPETKGHQYNCPHFKIVMRSILGQGSADDRQRMIQSLRLILQEFSHDEDKTQYSQFRDTLRELGVETD